MILRSPRSKRTRRRATCERSDATRKRGLRGKVPSDGPAVHVVQTRRHSSEHAVLPNPSIEGTSKGWRLGRPPRQTLNIMREAVIAEVSTQLSEVVGVIERHLEPTLLAVHLYGSAVDGGLCRTVILICWLR